MKSTILALLLLLIPIPVLSQEVGSAEAYRVLRDMQRRAQEQEIRTRKEHEEWLAAKKLFLVKPDTIQPSKAGHVSSSFVVGDTGCFDQFETAVSQIVDDKNMLLSFAEKNVWLADYPTDGLSDNQKVRLIGFLKVSGTKSYESVSGATRTAPVLKFLNAEETKAFQEKLKKEEDTKRKEAQDKLFRTWTLAKGKSVEGKVVEIKNGIVTFESRDGSQKRLNQRIFSDDQQKQMEKDLPQSQK